VLYFLFGMDAIERLRESAKRFLRWITDHLQETVRGRDIFRRYWIR